MSRKRCLSSSNDAGDVVVTASQQDSITAAHSRDVATDRQQKRCCGTSSYPAPGELSTEQVAEYLHSLSSHLDHSTVEHASRVLSAAGWQALAELNILLVSGALPCGSLHSYSCFTQQPREQLWQHYSKYAAGRAQLSPQQLELLRFMLEWVLSPFPNCSLTEVTLDLPPSMVSWASRWGTASGGHIKLVRLEAYAPLDPCSSSRAGATGQQPARVVYVPALL